MVLPCPRVAEGDVAKLGLSLAGGALGLGLAGSHGRRVRQRRMYPRRRGQAEPRLGGWRHPRPGRAASCWACAYSPTWSPFVPLAVGLGLLLLFFATKSGGCPGVRRCRHGHRPRCAGRTQRTAGRRRAPASSSASPLGFFLIWVLGLMFGIRAVRWWPLVPGQPAPGRRCGRCAPWALGPRLMQIAEDWWPWSWSSSAAYLLLPRPLRSPSAPEDDETSMVPAVGPTIGVVGQPRTDVVQRDPGPVAPPRPRGCSSAPTTTAPTGHRRRYAGQCRAGLTRARPDGLRRSGKQVLRAIGLAGPSARTWGMHVAADELELRDVRHIPEAEDGVHRARLGQAAEALHERVGRAASHGHRRC